MTEGELIKAIQTLRDYCFDGDCEFCQFKDKDGQCLFMSRYPDDWKISWAINEASE